MARCLKFVVVVLGASTLSPAADLAILHNGNSIRHERRQVVGAVTRLYLNDSASVYIEIPTSEIERFEVDTAPPPQTRLPVPGAQPTIPARVTAAPAAAIVQQRPSPVLDRAALGQLVNGAGEKNQIDPDFISSVIRAESGFNSRAVSKKGAQGLMQLMPQTASQLGVTNSFDPKANVEGGTKYLRELLEKYNYDVVKTLAAYNAGPQRVEQYHGVPPYYETRAYIARIIRDFNRQKLAKKPALAKKSAPTKQTSSQKKTLASRPALQGTERASR
jgi:soluble lytic murein transglycosylase-like protein